MGDETAKKEDVESDVEESPLLVYEGKNEVKDEEITQASSPLSLESRETPVKTTATSAPATATAANVVTEEEEGSWANDSGDVYDFDADEDNKLQILLKDDEGKGDESEDDNVDES